jgi:hypothetical protein
MTQKISAANIDDESLAKLGYDANRVSFPPKFYSVYATDGSFANLTPNQVSTSGGYIKILGDNFQSPMLVYIDNTPATLVTVQSTEELRVTVPAKSAGNYTVLVVKTDGSYASRIRSLTYA